ncbi:hypothetical protein SAVIM40S_00046 [Streptomyces avidinii]
MDEELQLLQLLQSALNLLGYDHEEPDEEGRDVRPPGGHRRRLARRARYHGPVPGSDRLVNAPQLITGAVLLVVVAWFAACAESGIARIELG